MLFILKVVSNLGNLNLHFHPENKYNRACIADKDMNSGLLIKMKTNYCSNNETVINYDIIGVVTANLKFNRKFYYLLLKKIPVLNIS